MDVTLQNTSAPEAPPTQQFSDVVSVGQPYRQYGNTSVSGSGLTIVGDVYTRGALFQPELKPDNIAKFGLCLGSAPQIDPAYFVGRAREIDEISRVLQPETGCAKQRRLILGGMGGVGKTQLSIAYAERHYQSYESIVWLNATSQLTLHADLRLLAGRILPAREVERLTEEQVLARVHEWLSNPSNTQWLVIFDNHDEPDQFSISKYCPFAAHGSVIVTTRLPDNIHLSSHHIRVQPLSDIKESLDILVTRSRRQNIRDGKLYGWCISLGR